jgi:hypothetical protein
MPDTTNIITMLKMTTCMVEHTAVHDEAFRRQMHAAC